MTPAAFKPKSPVAAGRATADLSMSSLLASGGRKLSGSAPRAPTLSLPAPGAPGRPAPRGPPSPSGALAVPAASPKRNPLSSTPPPRTVAGGDAAASAAAAAANVHRRSKSSDVPMSPTAKLPAIGRPPAMGAAKK
jgi:hypothetical protein